MLHMRRGKIRDRAAPVQRLLKPFGFPDLFRRGGNGACAGRAEKRTVLMEKRDGEHVGVALFNQVHLADPAVDAAVHVVGKDGRGKIERGEQPVDEDVHRADRLQHRFLRAVDGVLLQKIGKRRDEACRDEHQQHRHARHERGRQLEAEAASARILSGLQGCASFPLRACEGETP